MFKATDFIPGERVKVEGHSHGEGTFMEYGDPRFACSDRHITYPGMRIVRVNLDRYGASTAWENAVRRVS